MKYSAAERAVVVGAEVDVVVGQHGGVILRAHHARGLALGEHAQVARGADAERDEHQAGDREAGDVEALVAPASSTRLRAIRPTRASVGPKRP